MIKIVTALDLPEADRVPQEVLEKAEMVVEILSEAYGVNRHPEKDLGGYVLIIESEEEVRKLEDIYIDVNESIPEYVEKIECGCHEVWLHVLYLLSSDYSVTLLLPENLASKYLMKRMEEDENEERRS